MISVNFYKFTKKINSLKIPTTETTSRTYQCLLREPTSIVNPVLELMGRRNSYQVIGDDIYTFNYVYIDKFKRYYFVNDVVYNNNMWVISLVVDVLATYRNDIMNSRQYIIRNATEYDDTIIDSQYPTTSEVYTTRATNFTVVKQGSNTISNYFERDITSGSFVIGVIGENTGGISYYSFSYTAFKNLINYLMSFTPSDMSDISTGIAKQLANPLQYIVSCFWYPWVPAGNQISQLKFGYYTIEAYGYKLAETDYIKWFSFTVTIPKHPQATARGSYLNSPPYAQYLFDFQPFGSINISSLEIAYKQKLMPKWYIDYTTGQASLQLMFENDTDSCIGIYPAQYGIPIRLSQANVDFLGIGNAFLGGLGSLFLGSGIIGKTLGVGSNIINGIESAQPKVSGQGNQGSFLQQRHPELYGTFNKIVLEDLANLGRPLFASKRIDNISGFTIVDRPHIEIAGTQQEADEILSYLSNGFYIE